MKRLISMIMAFCLMIGVSGCGAGKDEPQQDKAMGRYIETPIAENFDGANISMNLHKTEDGVVFYTSGYLDDPNKLLRQTVKEDGTITTESLVWLQSLSEMGLMLSDLAETADGTVYLLARDMQKARIFRTSVDNTELEEISITDWPKTSATSGVMIENGGTVFFGDGESSGKSEELTDAIPTGILTAPEGFLLIYGDQIEYRNLEGSKQKTFNGFLYLFGNDITVQGNQLIIKNRQAVEIQIYDLNSGEVVKKQPYDESVFSSSQLLSDEQHLYLVNNSGIYQQNSDGTLWEKLVDGELTSLNIPSKEVMAAELDGAEGFYVILGDATGFSLMHYTYSPDTPTQPDTELTIFSLKDSNIIRQAIGEFQRQNPNVKVSLQVGLGNEEDAATIQDIVLSLNTEILNGNGPDMIVLDGLPAESYLEKGVLTDLTEFAAQMGDSVAENLLTGYQRDGKLYAIPAQFTVPIYLSQDKGQGITDFTSLVERAKAGATDTPPYLLAPITLGDGTEDFLMNWYDRIGLELIDNQALNTEMLTTFFKEIKELQDVQLSYTDNSSSGMVMVAALSGGAGGFEVLDMGPDRLYQGEASAYAMTLSGQGNLGNLKKLAEDAKWQLTSLFNKNQFIPLVNVGILEGSQQKELAQSFLKTLYGQSVQSVYLGAGFPINRDALKMTVEKELSDETGTLYPMGQQFYDLCQQVDHAILLDETVRDAVNTQAKFVLEGTVSPEEAAQSVNDTIKIYLAE